MRPMDSPILQDKPPLGQILVADDSPVFRDMLQKMLLEWGYETIAVSDGRQAWDLLRQENGPRLALLDWMMPGMEGAEVCRQVRAGVRDRYVYMILLSVRAGLDDVVTGIESGADDYIVKPFEVDELHARVRAGRRVLALQEELVEAREALRDQATRDGLTGLWNRTAIFDILQNELARSGRSGEPLIVLMADLDGFKPVNDRFGHMAGDAVLRQVAARMRAAVRRYDAVGRYGGEVRAGGRAGAGGTDTARYRCRMLPGRRRGDPADLQFGSGLRQASGGAAGRRSGARSRRRALPRQASGAGPGGRGGGGLVGQTIVFRGLPPPRKRQKAA